MTFCCNIDLIIMIYHRLPLISDTTQADNKGFSVMMCSTYQKIQSTNCHEGERKSQLLSNIY